MRWTLGIDASEQIDIVGPGYDGCTVFVFPSIA